MHYKKSKLEQKKVLDMLSVLPKEMQAICDREAVSLSEEEEKKNFDSVSETSKPEPPQQSVVIEEKQGIDVHAQLHRGLISRNYKVLLIYNDIFTQSDFVKFIMPKPIILMFCNSDMHMLLFPFKYIVIT